MTTKAERVKLYNELYHGYDITNIKKMDKQDVDWFKNYGVNSLDELYKRPSDAKVTSWREIVRTYSPKEIIGFMGNSMTYSVLIVAQNGSVLHITRNNNYLIEVKED